MIRLLIDLACPVRTDCWVVVLLITTVLSGTVRGQQKYDVVDSLDLLPTPKEVHLEGGAHVLDGWSIAVMGSHSLLRVGAAELNDRIRSLGGFELPVYQTLPSNGPVIVLGRWNDPSIRVLSTHLGTELTSTNPGEQGYVIRFGKYQGRTIVLLGGSDADGVLYACVTMRRLLQSRRKDVIAVEATVRDWPDFKVRANGSIDLDVLRETKATLTNLDPLDAAADSLKRQIDFYLRHKINVLRAGFFFPDDGTSPALFEQQRARALEVLHYADRHGIDTKFGSGVEIGRYLTLEEREMAVERFPGSSYMWAAFEAHRKKARRMARFIREARGDIFSLHPLDNGFYPDPELWSQRDPQTRHMYGDDRARAQLEQHLLYFNVVRERNPNISLESVVYPYHFQAARDDFPERYEELTWGMPNIGKFGFIQDRTHAQRVQDRIVEFHERMAKGLPDDIAIVFREASRTTLRATTNLYPNHPITIWIYPGRNRGWFGPFTPQVRFARSFWMPDRRDHYYLASDMTRFNDGRVQRLAQQEYLWDTDRPDASDGFTLFSRFYAEEGRNVTRFQTRHLAPRIARILYGSASPAFDTLITANPSLHYVTNPELVSRVAWATEYFDSPSKYMAEQADIFHQLADRFRTAIDRLLDANGGELPATRTSAWLIHHYRYSGLAAVKARLDAAVGRVDRLIEAHEAVQTVNFAQKIINQLPDLKARCEQLRRRTDHLMDQIGPVYTFAPPYKSDALAVLDTLDPTAYTERLQSFGSP